MAINPGVANPADWAHVAHKGGSETGVLNLSTLVTDAQGRKSCVVVTVNDSKPVNENACVGGLSGGAEDTGPAAVSKKGTFWKRHPQT